MIDNDTRARRVGLTASIALALVLAAASPASAVDWDGAMAARIADELHESIEALLRDPGVAPEQASAMQDRRHAGALANVRNLERTTQQLAKMLRDGLGRGPTEAHFVRIEELIDEVGELARTSTIGDSARTHARNARSLYDRLARFYR